jgi:methylenetetrahydrofolate dehydrogenase (NADP+)/methenyltetrahydrofolate cyclohydrolase
METKTAKLLDGKALAAKIQQELSVAITQLQPKIGRPSWFSSVDGWR